MGEKPLRSAGAVVALDPKTFSMVREALRTSRMFDQKTLSSVSQAAKTFSSLDTSKLVTPSVMRAATVALDSSRLVDTAAFSRALTEINKANMARISESIKVLSEVNTIRIADMLKEVHPSAALLSGISETLRTLDFPASFRSQVAEALAANSGPLAANFGWQFQHAVEEAVAIADSPSLRERVKGSLVDLEHLSPAERHELQGNVANAIATLGIMVAIIVGDARIELAAESITFLAILVSIYWGVSGNRQD